MNKRLCLVWLFTVFFMNVTLSTVTLPNKSYHCICTTWRLVDVEQKFLTLTDYLRLSIFFVMVSIVQSLIGYEMVFFGLEYHFDILLNFVIALSGFLTLIWVECANQPLYWLNFNFNCSCRDFHAKVKRTSLTRITPSCHVKIMITRWTRLRSKMFTFANNLPTLVAICYYSDNKQIPDSCIIWRETDNS